MEDKPLIDVSQGVPGSGPHEILREALSTASASDEGNEYGPILGEGKLRQALADEMNTVYRSGSRISADDVALTAGCNLAFFAAIMALAGPGDEIILPVPW